MPQKRAKLHIRKLRTLRILYSVLTILYAVVLVALLLTDRLTVSRYLLYLLIPYLPWKLLWMVIETRVRKKYLYDVLYEELNPPLFLEILRYVSRDDPFALGQLYELHAKGLHADLISLCAKQLNNPYAKRYRLTYLTYMEEAYFKLGDDQRLREIHETAERELTALKNSDKVRKKLPAHGFHTAYLSRDTDACEAYFTANPPLNRYSEVNRLLLRARVAQLRGDSEEARRLLGDALTEAPDTALAATAKAHLEALERGEGYESAYPEALPDPLFPVVTTEKKHRVYRILYRVILAFLVAMIFLYAFSLHREREERQYWESMEAAVQEYFVDAELLGLHEITEDGRAVDVIAVCQCQDRVVLGGIYLQSDTEGEELMFRFGTSFSGKDVQDSLLPSKAYITQLSNQFVFCELFATEENVPENACFSYSVTLNETTYWLAVTYAGDDVP